MGILGQIFGSDKTIAKITDGIFSGMDKMVFTEEERKDNFRQTLKLYEPFKVAQRYLACIFTVPYVLAWFITFAASFVVDVSTQMDMLFGTMGNIVLAIVAFYFAGGVVSGFKAEKK